jgi:hypothetical protein
LGFRTVVVANRYRLVRKLVVAVKVLHRQHVEDRTRRERFFRGSRLMKKLSHPAIVRVLQESGEQGTALYFVMEFVSGGDLLHAVLAGRVSIDQTLQVLLEVGEALEHAHGAGIIHRDVKPANVLLSDSGTLKLTDFDLGFAAETRGGTRTEGMGWPIPRPRACCEARRNLGAAALELALSLGRQCFPPSSPLKSKCVPVRAGALRPHLKK